MVSHQKFIARGTTIVWAGVVLAVLFAGVFAYIWLTRWITEFAITDRRVISKHGFIRRNTAEMNMAKVESVNAEQSVLGRLVEALNQGLDDPSVHRAAVGTRLGVVDPTRNRRRRNKFGSHSAAPQAPQLVAALREASTIQQSGGFPLLATTSYAVAFGSECRRSPNSA